MIYTVVTKAEGEKKTKKTKVYCSCMNDAEVEARSMEDQDLEVVDIYRESSWLEDLCSKVRSKK